jgi:predicted acetyltransferase
MEVQAVPAGERERQVVKNLFAFYQYDLMAYLDDGPGSAVNRHGAIGGEEAHTHADAAAGLDVWWERPGVLFPFLIRVGEAPAGFALIAGRPHCTPERDFLMNDFFILPGYRRTGVGRQAAVQLFERFSGLWEVGQLPSNLPAVHFWTRVIADYTGGAYETGEVIELPGQIFRSPPPQHT